MLCLSMDKGDVVKIGDSIEVLCISIRGDKVRLGFKAPPSVEIDRLCVRESKEETGNRKRLPEQSTLAFTKKISALLEVLSRTAGGGYCGQYQQLLAEAQQAIANEECYGGVT